MAGKVKNIKLDTGNAQLIKNIHAERDNGIKTLNASTNRDVGMICSAFLNAKGLKGAWSLSEDGATLIPKDDDTKG